MGNGLEGLWIVGDVKWRVCTASVCVTRTKTDARRSAERRLLKAEEDGRIVETHYWKEREAWRKRGVTGNTPLEFARNMLKKRDRLDSGMWYFQQYVTAHEGVPITGPKGERMLITEPSKAARAEREKCKRREKRRMEGYARALVGARG
jgi:hypothetical protein